MGLGGRTGNSPGSSPPAATASAAQLCVPVHLTGDGKPVSSDDGLIHTTATVSLFGFKVAKTDATFTPSAPVGGVLPFSGPIVFTTAIGGLSFTAEVQGTVDLSTGAFQATSTSVTGTRPLTGISGSLKFQGLQNADGTFTETIDGTLCSPVRR